ncbi:SprT-like domain-containing protein [Ferruginibacter albus]|uniref:SprT-like domain-containing protein n=1 Tax=Ferruginibacter albus TaxID=2875540 RepID=UPI001CC3FA6E|nr:SprT-like domain-containing protein [Ferruginibacter albus]UAY51494.1 SprT-like domain-containing protein [Ferruginibacter albus]
MSKQEAPLQQLKTYLPEESFDAVVHYLQHYKVHLTITRERATVLGDYRHSHLDKNHRISVNGNLNKYSFLITLLHELAHLFTYERFGHRVQAHGAEWKNEYSKILAQFLLKKIFPADIEKVLLKTLQNPAASSCADESLLRVLHKYDEKKEGVQLIELLTPGTLFKIKGDRIFRREEQVRKRIRCVEIKTGKVYLFSPVYEVILLS